MENHKTQPEPFMITHHIELRSWNFRDYFFSFRKSREWHPMSHHVTDTQQLPVTSLQFPFSSLCRTHKNKLEITNKTISLQTQEENALDEIVSAMMKGVVKFVCGKMKTEVSGGGWKENKILLWFNVFTFGFMDESALENNVLWVSSD